MKFVNKADHRVFIQAKYAKPRMCVTNEDGSLGDYIVTGMAVLDPSEEIEIPEVSDYVAYVGGPVLIIGPKPEPGAGLWHPE